ncbi:MAG: L17 family ribosomal protein [Microgenomates group bacterium]
MNHRKFGIKLGRNRREREALFKSLVRSVFTHGTIQTTSAKARSVVPIIEKLANHIMVKDVVLASRELSTYIQDKNLVSQIVASAKSAFADQTSNFTTMSKVKIRLGDDALIVKFGFVKPYKLIIKDKKEVIKKEAVKKEVLKKAVAKKVVKSKVSKTK